MTNQLNLKDLFLLLVVGNKTRVSALTTSIQLCIGGVIIDYDNKEIRDEKEIKCIQIVKKKVKLFPFACDMILYRHNSKGSTKTVRIQQGHKIYSV